MADGKAVHRAKGSSEHSARLDGRRSLVNTGAPLSGGYFTTSDSRTGGRPLDVLMERRMRWKSQVRCGGRRRGDHRPKSRHRRLAVDPTWLTLVLRAKSASTQFWCDGSGLRCRRARLEHHERDLALGALLVAAVPGISGERLGPKSLTLLRRGDLRADGSVLSPDLHCCVRVRAEVVIPPRVVGVPALGRNEDNVGMILNVHQRRGALDAGLGADVVEQQYRWRTGKPVSDHPVREAIDQRMSAHQATQNRPRSVS